MAKTKISFDVDTGGFMQQIEDAKSMKISVDPSTGDVENVPVYDVLGNVQYVAAKKPTAPPVDFLNHPLLGHPLEKAAKAHKKLIKPPGPTHKVVKLANESTVVHTYLNDLGSEEQQVHKEIITFVPESSTGVDVYYEPSTQSYHVRVDLRTHVKVPAITLMHTSGDLHQVGYEVIQAAIEELKQKAATLISKGFGKL